MERSLSIRSKSRDLSGPVPEGSFQTIAEERSQGLAFPNAVHQMKGEPYTSRRQVDLEWFSSTSLVAQISGAKNCRQSLPDSKKERAHNQDEAG